MKPCTGILGRLFGHKYESRYDSVGNRVQTSPGTFYSYTSTASEEECSDTYVHDVCVRCGDVIGRSECVGEGEQR